MLTEKQMLALSDAHAESGQLHGGLSRFGARWIVAERSYSDRTVQSLVDRGLLKLWVGGAVAHITDLGVDVLNEFRSEVTENG